MRLLHLNKSALFLLIFPLVAFADESNINDYYLEIKKTREDVNPDVSRYVYDKIMKRQLPSHINHNGELQFGLHGMETPAISVKKDSQKIDKAFELLSRAGVDSLRSSETAWHRVADSTGEPNNFSEVDFQLQKAKKYNFTHLFVFGYPPAKYTVANNKLSAVNPKYYTKYKTYLDNTLSHLKGYDVQYAELGNEVDAPNTWWMKSSPQMYVNEMKILKEAIQRSGLNIKTVAFSATYSRTEGMGGEKGGRNFVNKSFELGIDNYTDAYSIHHFVFGADDLPNYMRSEMESFGVKNKPILDTEQLDTSAAGKGMSNPYDLVKLFARAFFVYDMKRMDYFLAQDRFLNGKLYSSGLFDADWNPKLRLLAYAMAVDAIKGKQLLYISEPGKDIEAYILESPGNDVSKYTILLWKNFRKNEKVTATEVRGLSGSGVIEHWNLDAEKYDSSNRKLMIDNRPIAIYTNKLPDWKPVDKKVLSSTDTFGIRSYAPMPTD